MRKVALRGRPGHRACESTEELKKTRRGEYRGDRSLPLCVRCVKHSRQHASSMTLNWFGWVMGGEKEKKKEEAM